MKYTLLTTTEGNTLITLFKLTTGTDNSDYTDLIERLQSMIQLGSTYQMRKSIN